MMNMFGVVVSFELPQDHEVNITFRVGRLGNKFGLFLVCDIDIRFRYVLNHMCARLCYSGILG
ncbi:hypothetical protein HanPSC8_Chr10g0448651 [Helianthus annuus]|nr:hypothetical protein HanPSC8_Chr10g0448651 [Helianthus annuus]